MATIFRQTDRLSSKGVRSILAILCTVLSPKEPGESDDILRYPRIRAVTMVTNDASNERHRPKFGRSRIPRVMADGRYGESIRLRHCRAARYHHSAKCDGANGNPDAGISEGTFG